MKKLSLLIIVLLCGVVFWPPAQPAQALGQRQVVKYIRAIAADLELTPTQVENLTAQQAFNYLIAKYPSLPAAKIKEFAHYWSGIKGLLLRDAIAREIAANEITVRNGFVLLFPDAVVEHPRVVEAIYVLAVAARGDPNAL